MALHGQECLGPSFVIGIERKGNLGLLNIGTETLGMRSMKFVVNSS